MNELKAVARLIAQERGEAVRLTDRAHLCLSIEPMVVVPITMAGNSPSLFAIGIGDGMKPCRIYVCPKPRNRDYQYDFLRRAAADIEQPSTMGEHPATMPQIITSSRRRTASLPRDPPPHDIHRRRAGLEPRRA